MISLEEVYNAINSIAPFDSAEPYDNVGIIFEGSRMSETVLFSLDVTSETLKEAEQLGCSIIVSHHPAIFGGLKQIKYTDVIAEAIRKDISLIAAHTNFDRAKGGTNDILATLLEVTVEEEIYSGLGRKGYLKKSYAPLDFIEFVKKMLGAEQVYAVTGDRSIDRVAIIAGSSGDISDIFSMDIDAVVTGETKYFYALEAKRNNISLVVAGHYQTENIGFMNLKNTVHSMLKDKATCIYSNIMGNPYIN